MFFFFMIGPRSRPMLVSSSAASDGDKRQLIGSARILDSMGLVNIVVDIETAFLDEDIEISLTSETAMSGRISPFRTIGSLCNFIARQLGLEE